MASSGGIGLAKASISNNTLTINAVAPSDIISTANDIIGALGSNTNINLKYLDTLYTSTYLTYLVIGSEVDGDVNFYSLPVVGTEANKGMIADLNSVPKEVYVDNKLTERVFYVPALTSSDFDIAAHPELKIGGSKVLPGDFAQISSMSSSGDAVFISVKSGDNTGIFYSRAIFDENGVIAGWTDWQSSAGGDMPAEAVLLNKRNADIWTVTNNAYDVRRTVWGVDYNDGILGGTIDSNGYAQLNNLFFEDGGIQSLNEITNQGGISTFALTITTGYKKVALANTGICNGSYYTPNVGDYKTNSVYSEDGSWINADNSSRFIAISGGELDNIGPVVTSTIYTNLNENWLIVAGYGGLAVMQNNGNGWQNLSGLVFNGGFKLIDGPDRIIKILSDNNYLYILTQNNLYKAKLDAASINQGEYLEINSIAQTDEDNKVFYDFVINKGNIYLATALGLYYLDGTWQKVAIPGVNLPVNFINIIKTDFADQLYTLSGYRGFNESFENRFYIPNNQIMPVPLPDKIFRDSGIPFLNFGSFIDYFYTDGFRWLRMQAKNGKTNALLAQIVNTKTLFAGINGLTLPFTNSSYVGKILQLKSVGSLLINGSFGLWINE